MGLLNNPLPSPSISTVEMPQAEFNALSIIPSPWGKWCKPDKFSPSGWSLVEEVDGHEVLSWIVSVQPRVWWRPGTWRR